MKSNKCSATRDDAVSPVIAVILMVAITVVLAATVYVWVSSIGGQSGAPAKSIALTSAGAQTAGFEKNYTVASASPGLKWGDLQLLVDGTPYAYATGPVPGNGEWGGWSAGALEASGGIVDAGDALEVDGAADLSGKKLVLVDAASNSLVYSLTVT